MEREIATQERQMRLAPQGDAVKIVAIGHRAANHEEQNLGQRMGDAPGLARVFDDRKMIEQRTKARLLRKHIKSKAHGGGSESTAQWNHANRNPLSRVNLSSKPCCSPGHDCAIDPK